MQKLGEVPKMSYFFLKRRLIKALPPPPLWTLWPSEPEPDFFCLKYKKKVIFSLMAGPLNPSPPPPPLNGSAFKKRFFAASLDHPKFSVLKLLWTLYQTRHDVKLCIVTYTYFLLEINSLALGIKTQENNFVEVP